MRAYSQDLRDRILHALARGDRPTEIARRFEVSRVQALVRLWWLGPSQRPLSSLSRSTDIARFA
jgi:hypothetical protein